MIELDIDLLQLMQEPETGSNFLDWRITCCSSFRPYYKIDKTYSLLLIIIFIKFTLLTDS